MKNIKFIYSKAILLILGLVVITNISCERDLSSDAELAGYSKEGDVYIDGFTGGLDYYPFGDSYFEAFSVDTETKYDGSSAMRFDVPNVGDPAGAYAGAIFRLATGRDLTGYDALTFWAKATTGGTINEIGFGQDFGENKYQVSTSFQLTSNWRKYIIPIPDPSKLTQERGMFWYAEGPENGIGYSFWIDNLQFETLGTIAQPRPSIFNGDDTVQKTFIGSNIVINGLTQTFNLATGNDQTVSAAPGYFTFNSTNPSVATVNEQGKVSVVGSGNTLITATLGGIAAKGSLSIESLGVFTPAPTPTRDASNVISIFSDAYTNAPVEYYNGYWAPYQTTQGQADININGNNIIKYSQFNFVGIQFSQPTINASQMTHIHLDVQVQNTTGVRNSFKIAVNDFGPDGAFGGGNDSGQQITITNANLPSGNWVSLDIPLSNFTGLTSKANLAQIVLESASGITDILVDNVYFYAVPTAPSGAAPTPTVPSSNVVSIFSDAYTNVTGTDFNPPWGQATVVAQVPVGGNNTLRYTGLNYQGIQIGSAQNVSGMTHLHLDYYTANSTSLNVYLISPGPVEKAKVLTVPTTSGWVNMEIPLTDFAPVNLSNVIQLKFDGNGTIYLDNIYFHN